MAARLSIEITKSCVVFTVQTAYDTRPLGPLAVGDEASLLRGMLGACGTLLTAGAQVYYITAKSIALKLEPPPADTETPEPPIGAKVDVQA